MNIEWLRNRPVAHRGLHDIKLGVPENSPLAFQRAIDAGHPIELDVHLSADGVPVVFHDYDLKRLTGRDGTLLDIDSTTLATLPLLGTGERVPTLAQVCAQVAGRVPLLIEIKYKRGFTPPTLPGAVAQVMDGYDGAFAVQSFHPGTVAWFQRNRPSWVRGQISDGRESTRRHTPLLRYLVLQLLLRRLYGAPHFIAYNVRYLPELLTVIARARGLPVLAWTVRTAEDRATAARHADNIIFETLS